MNSEVRKEQLRESQRRRREKLAASGARNQVNIYLTQQSKELIDGWCNQFSIDRHDLLNGLITAFSKSPNSIPFKVPVKS